MYKANKMNCKEANKSVIKFLEKELTPEKEYELKEHLNGCHKCSGLYSSVEMSYNSLNTVREIEPKSFFTESVMNKIDDEKVTESILDVTIDIAISKFFKKFAYTGVAFIIALFILLYTTNNFLLFNSSSDDDDFSANKITSVFFDNN